MAGLDPATHVLGTASLKAWIPGTSPGMTARELESPQWRSRIVQRVKRWKPSPPLWGRVGEGGAAPDWNQQSASTPSLALPHKGGGEWRLILNRILRIL